jgi:hypothetical protein
MMFHQRDYPEQMISVLEYDEELLEYDVEVLLEIIWTNAGCCLSLFVPYKRQERASLCSFRFNSKA